MPDVRRARSEPIGPIRIAQPGATILEEYGLIFFGSRQQANIYITAHGVISDQQQFTPPVACQFYLAHGGNLTYHMRNFPNFARGFPPAAQLHAAAAPNCWDYKLIKYQGRHSADAMMGHFETYNQIAACSVAANATIVTIRNRIGNSYKRLSSVIARIQANCPNVVTVHGLFCRETNPQVAANDASACPRACFVCGAG